MGSFLKFGQAVLENRTYRFTINRTHAHGFTMISRTNRFTITNRTYRFTITDRTYGFTMTNRTYGFTMINI